MIHTLGTPRINVPASKRYHNFKVLPVQPMQQSCGLQYLSWGIVGGLFLVVAGLSAVGGWRW